MLEEEWIEGKGNEVCLEQPSSHFLLHHFARSLSYVFFTAFLLRPSGKIIMQIKLYRGEGGGAGREGAKEEPTRTIQSCALFCSFMWHHIFFLHGVRHSPTTYV